MFLVIGSALGRHEVAAVRDFAAGSGFEDGRATAGRFAREVKRNDQALGGAAFDAVVARVEATLMGNALFLSAARPRRIARFLISRYRPGQSYGMHVDDAIMGGHRTDLSFTIFLSEEADYDGGALIVEEAIEARAIRLAPGDMLLYPSNTLHRVEEVTRGERLAIVGWVTSWVKHPAEREILFDLDEALAEIHAASGKTPLFDRLAKTRSNLLRIWAEG